MGLPRETNFDMDGGGAIRAPRGRIPRGRISGSIAHPVIPPQRRRIDSDAAEVLLSISPSLRPQAPLSTKADPLAGLASLASLESLESSNNDSKNHHGSKAVPNHINDVNMCGSVSGSDHGGGGTGYPPDVNARKRPYGASFPQTLEPNFSPSSNSSNNSPTGASAGGFGNMSYHIGGGGFGGSGGNDDRESTRAVSNRLRAMSNPEGYEAWALSSLRRSFDKRERMDTLSSDDEFGPESDDDDEGVGGDKSDGDGGDESDDDGGDSWLESKKLKLPDRLKRLHSKRHKKKSPSSASKKLNAKHNSASSSDASRARSISDAERMVNRYAASAGSGTGGACPEYLMAHTKYAEIYNKNGRIGIYTRQERDLIIQRFNAKRARRVWKKKIRYGCRKNLADRRLRVKGRFVKISPEELAKIKQEELELELEQEAGGGGGRGAVAAAAEEEETNRRQQVDGGDEYGARERGQQRDAPGDDDEHETESAVDSSAAHTTGPSSASESPDIIGGESAKLREEEGGVVTRLGKRGAADTTRPRENGKPGEGGGPTTDESSGGSDEGDSWIDTVPPKRMRRHSIAF